MRSVSLVVRCHFPSNRKGGNEESIMNVKSRINSKFQTTFREEDDIGVVRRYTCI